MQFYSFLKNIENILKTFNKDGKYALMQETAQNPQSPNGQLGLFAQAVQTQVNKSEMNYESKLITDSQDLADLVKKLKSSSLITYKTYSQYENATNFDLTGVAVAINKDYSYDSSIKITDTNAKNECYYIPVGHNIENQLPEKDVFEQLKDVLQNPEIKKFTHDVKNELNIANRYGVQLQGVVFDTMLASYIKDSAASNAFDIQCMERINHILNSVITDNKKVKFTDYDVENIKTYTGDCSSGLFELTKFWINNLDKQEYKILTDIEIPLSYVLSGMELNGVSVDTDYLKQLTKELDAQISQLEQRIYELAGSTFNINSPKQVGEILFDKLNIQTGKKRGKNKKSTSAQVLNELAQDHEIVQRILDYRKYAKLKSTYTESLPELIDPRDNRIHTTYNQALTTTGRLSSSNPNLQNIPVRTPEGNKIRQAFIPKDRENSVILSADYSQIELRLLAHVSEDEHLIEAFKSGVDVHTLTASKVFGVPVDEVTKDMRRRSKAVNFGIVYGQSKYGLAKALKITNDEAESFINKYFETYPKVKLYMQAMVELVEKQGYVETIFGRKRYLDKEINSPNGMIREFAKRAAINHPMQGSASDLIKIAMIDFYKKLKDNNLKSELIIQVHDELVVEVKKSELDTVTELVKQAMELNQPLRVPLLVDINTGASWKES